MRTLKRNQRKFWYCTDTGDREVIYDEWGNATGEYIPVYNEEQEMYANISPASGYAQTEQFGNLESYDKVIVTDWMGCPIDENSVLFIDKEPEHDASHGLPLYDYTVRRVAKSLNSISIAVQKVDVG